MEYVTSLRDGKSGIVVSIDCFGVATLLARNKSERHEQDEQHMLRMRGVTRQAGVDEAEEKHTAASRERNIGRYNSVTGEMRSLNQSWSFDFETATEEAARVGGALFGTEFDRQKFTVCV
jgi:hypothetical protein